MFYRRHLLVLAAGSAPWVLGFGIFASSASGDPGSGWESVQGTPGGSPSPVASPSPLGVVVTGGESRIDQASQAERLAKLRARVAGRIDAGGNSVLSQVVATPPAGVASVSPTPRRMGGAEKLAPLVFAGRAADPAPSASPEIVVQKVRGEDIVVARKEVMAAVAGAPGSADSGDTSIRRGDFLDGALAQNDITPGQVPKSEEVLPEGSPTNGGVIIGHFII